VTNVISQPLARQRGITLIELLISMIILGVVTTMLLAGWATLQKSYAHSVKSNNARAEVRDAMARVSREIRDAQPVALTTPPSSPFTLAGPNEVDFYSAFNSPDVSADGSGLDALRLTRIYLDTSGGAAQKTLYWQRDTNDSGSFDGADRKIVLARDVVNASFPSAGSPTAVFTYGYRDGSGDFTTATTIGSADLSKIISVHIRLIVDANLAHSPAPADLETTVRPRNAPQN
jgi:prepilin-type N-terminal cleavage/methylation domain-containing protein